MTTDQVIPEMEDPVDRLVELCRARGWDYGVRLDIVYESAWSCEVRITREPGSKGRPDRSLVTFAAGGATGADVLAWATDEAIAWATEDAS